MFGVNVLVQIKSRRQIALTFLNVEDKKKKNRKKKFRRNSASNLDQTVTVSLRSIEPKLQDRIR